jgi:hypothetical protein
VQVTAARAVLVGAVLLVVLGGVYVADRNRAHSRIEKYGFAENGDCVNEKTGFSAPMSKCDESRSEAHSWRTRKGWYEYAAAALVVLTLAGAFAASRRERTT